MPYLAPRLTAHHDLGPDHHVEIAVFLDAGADPHPTWAGQEGLRWVTHRHGIPAGMEAPPYVECPSEHVARLVRSCSYLGQEGEQPEEAVEREPVGMVMWIERSAAGVCLGINNARIRLEWRRGRPLLTQEVWQASPPKGWRMIERSWLLQEVLSLLDGTATQMDYWWLASGRHKWAQHGPQGLTRVDIKNGAAAWIKTGADLFSPNGGLLMEAGWMGAGVVELERAAWRWLWRRWQRHVNRHWPGLTPLRHWAKANQTRSESEKQSLTEGLQVLSGNGATVPLVWEAPHAADWDPREISAVHRWHQDKWLGSIADGVMAFPSAQAARWVLRLEPTSQARWVANATRAAAASPWHHLRAEGLLKATLLAHLLAPTGRRRLSAACWAHLTKIPLPVVLAAFAATQPTMWANHCEGYKEPPWAWPVWSDRTRVFLGMLNNKETSSTPSSPSLLWGREHPLLERGRPLLLGLGQGIAWLVQQIAQSPTWWFIDRNGVPSRWKKMLEWLFCNEGWHLDDEGGQPVIDETWPALSQTLARDRRGQGSQGVWASYQGWNSNHRKAMTAPQAGADEVVWTPPIEAQVYQGVEVVPLFTASGLRAAGHYFLNCLRQPTRVNDEIQKAQNNQACYVALLSEHGDALLTLTWSQDAGWAKASCLGKANQAVTAAPLLAAVAHVTALCAQRPGPSPLSIEDLGQGLKQLIGLSRELLGWLSLPNRKPIQAQGDRLTPAQVCALGGPWWAPWVALASAQTSPQKPTLERMKDAWELLEGQDEDDAAAVDLSEWAPLKLNASPSERSNGALPGAPT